MSTFTKLVAKFKTTPPSRDITITELVQIMEHYNFEVRIGNHNIFRHKEYKDLGASIPTISGKLVKPYYIKQCQQLIIEIEERNNEK